MTEETKDDKKQLSGAAIRMLIAKSFEAGYNTGFERREDRHKSVIEFIKSIDLKEAITNKDYFTKT